RPNGGEPSDALVLFGATGDLAKKKIFPAVYEMAVQREHPVPVVGFASSDWDDDRLRQHAREAIEAKEETVDEDAWTDLAGRICFVKGDYREDASYAALAEKLKGLGVERPLYYLAIPP